MIFEKLQFLLLFRLAHNIALGVICTYHVTFSQELPLPSPTDSNPPPPPQKKKKKKRKSSSLPFLNRQCRLPQKASRRKKLQLTCLLVFMVTCKECATMTSDQYQTISTCTTSTIGLLTTHNTCVLIAFFFFDLQSIYFRSLSINTHSLARKVIGFLKSNVI